MTKIYHHNDNDGRAAAAIAYRSEMVNRQAELIEMDYKTPVPIEGIQPGEHIIILDFSFKPDVMDQVLARTSNVTWIDHHATAMEYDYGRVLKGTRTESYSGCELAWIYFCKPDIPMPCSIRLIGDRDKWANKLGDMTAQFNEGIKMFSHGPADPIWDDLLGKEKSLQQIIDLGKAAILYRNNFCLEYMKLCGYQTTFEGLNCLAVNLYSLGSETFGPLFEQFDACLTYVHDGTKFQVSMYSHTRDVKDIAVKYGGGGHPRACGWVCDTLPFERKA